MNKIIGLSLIFLFVGLSSFAQTTEVATKTDAKKACCTPSEACAAKYGITLEECKAICSKMNGESSVELTESETAVASQMMESNTAKKSCCASLASCAKEMGMTVEECKAKCGIKGSTVSADGTTQVAAAMATSETNDGETKKVCNKSSKACCKKK